MKKLLATFLAVIMAVSLAGCGGGESKPETKPAAPAKTAAAGEYDRGVKKGNKRQISLTIAPDLLRRVDEVAERTGQGRAAIINMAIFRALEGDIFKA